ncbi:DUF4328 domain-containing protein [Agromyces protaetiae]|uniref:DUF4328 domain-containing protein n=1 Tax=Agromyces protaetiae TaxID=2509455 RepID=A0A4P6FRA9_9MICO|nr:DUF4328 domain-containing protein [Agromyces protaetiae]QAY73068.1 DUF4328 domain-containing protein [Agromyces protaetiae]
MTETPTQPPAGWYPAPHGSQESWWWDGAKWVPPHALLPGASATKAGAIAKLAVATQVLLIVCGVVAVANLATEAFGIAAVTSFLEGKSAALDLIGVYDQASLIVLIVSAVSVIAAGIVWAIWQYQVAKQVVGRTRRSPGWHAGAWFVPVVNLWFPYQNISDLWKALGRVQPPSLVAWWLLWLVSNFVMQISNRIALNAVDLEQLRAAMIVTIVGEALVAGAAALACMVVRGITQGVREQASAPRFPRVA